MLKGIDQEKLAEVIRASYRFQTEQSSRSYAQEICSETDEMFSGLVQAWLDGEALPEVKVGKYTVKSIMNIRKTTDFLGALILLNEYKKDPVKGESAIWKPTRALQVRTDRKE